MGSAQLREKQILFEKLESSQLSAMCPKIGVPALMVFSNSIQIRGMYIIFILSENFVSKKDYIHNNVRKWPNLCSIKPQNILEGKLMSFIPID